MNSKIDGESESSSPIFPTRNMEAFSYDKELDGKNNSQGSALTKAYSFSSFAILSAYVAVWVFMYLLIHHVMNEDGKRILGAPCIVLTVEIVKFIISTMIFCMKPKKDNASTYLHRLKELFAFFKSRACLTLALSYMPVAVLYAFYNNLMLINLKSNYPTLYLILSSTRLLMMAFVWQIVFKVEISPRKKVSLVVIMLGYVARGLAEQDNNAPAVERHGSPDMIFGSLFVLLQMACSVLASVYNEKLLKYHESEEQQQNICLYMNSIAINLIISFATAWIFSEDTSQPSFDTSVFTPSMILVILTLAMSGIITSFVLRYTNSLAKSVASATETSITYLIQISFFHQGLEFFEALAVLLVTCGAIIYATDKQANKKNSVFDRDSTRLKRFEDRSIVLLGKRNRLKMFRDTNKVKMRRAKSFPLLMIGTYFVLSSYLIFSSPRTFLSSPKLQVRFSFCLIVSKRPNLIIFCATLSFFQAQRSNLSKFLLTDCSLYLKRSRRRQSNPV